MNGAQCSAMVRNAVRVGGCIFTECCASCTSKEAPHAKTERIQLIETEVPGTNPTCLDFYHFSHIASVVGFGFVKPPHSQHSNYSRNAPSGAQ